MDGTCGRKKMVEMSDLDKSMAVCGGLSGITLMSVAFALNILTPMFILVVVLITIIAAIFVNVISPICIFIVAQRKEKEKRK